MEVIFGLFGLLLPIIVGFLGNQNKKIKAAETSASKQIIELSEKQAEFSMEDAIELLNLLHM